MLIKISIFKKLTPFTMFTEAELIVIRDYLLQKVNDNLKNFRRKTDEDLKSLKIVAKINLFLGIQQVY